MNIVPFLSLTAALVSAGIFPIASARAFEVPAANLPEARAVGESSQALLSLQCEAIEIKNANVITTGGKPFHVIASDTGSAFLCPQTAISNLHTVSAGQVAGLINEANAGVGSWLCDNVWSEAGKWIFCGKSPVQSAKEAIKDEVKRATPAINTYLVSALLWVVAVIANLGNMLMSLSAGVFSFILTRSTFINNSFVTTGWPFVQGFANIGFVIALLFAAFATTLNLEFGGGVKKLLPRLLIAALLLNFSLVIGGAIIDTSRILMAIETTAIGNIKIDNFGASLLQNSAIVKVAYSYDSQASFMAFQTRGIPASAKHSLATSFSIIGKNIIACVFIWGLAIAFVFLSATFLIRYIILVVLLIFSPLAYLAMALPQAKGLAQTWWNNFLKWTFLGPIAVFLLVLLSKLNTTGLAGAVMEPGTSETAKITANMFNSTMQLMITIFLIFAACMIGKYAGGAGAGMAISLGKNVTGRAKNYGKAGLNYAWQNKTAAAGAVAGGMMLGPAGAVAGAAGGAYAARKWGSKVTNAIPTPTNRRNQREAADVRSMGTLTTTDVSDGRLVPTQLSKGHITTALGKDNVNVIAEHGSGAQLKALARNKDYVKSLNARELADFQVAMSRNGAASPADVAKAMDRLQQTLDELGK